MIYKKQIARLPGTPILRNFYSNFYRFFHIAATSNLTFFNPSKLTQITISQIAKLTRLHFYIISHMVILYYLGQGNFYIIWVRVILYYLDQGNFYILVLIGIIFYILAGIEEFLNKQRKG